MLSPCKDCKRRKVGCHDIRTCAEWNEYVAFNKAVKEARHEQARQEDDYSLQLQRHGRRLHQI